MGEPDLYVGPSTILDQDGRSIGYGLFSMDDINKGDKIAEYKGELISTSTATNENYQSDYVFQIDKDVCIDARDNTNCFARYANDPINPKKANAEFRIEDYQVFLYAKKKIKANSEIFVSYGPDYWCDTYHLERLDGDNQDLLMRLYPKVRKFIHKHYQT